MRAFRNLVFFVLMLAPAVMLRADDLSIFDTIGLLRAMRPAPVSKIVYVRLEREAGADFNEGSVQVVLTEDGGVLHDIIGSREPDNRWIFRSVSKGNWRIVVKGGPALVAEVEVAE